MGDDVAVCKKKPGSRLWRTTLDFLFLMAGLAAIIGGAILLVWPLWYLATHHVRLYTSLTLGLIGLALLVVLALRWRSRRRRQA
ncbi:MAG: hypothetical protein A2087_14820 [Spirochaetes bacterium GWD1_61_31]|nr:MAG: hypothetical protein A2Y37_09770 [Spirochaetes bacterium GWB1_60_80]OHD31695.1 MAG: hypothetical protein A2004_03310 [Spirochaetes bacterium GWC1_61_12]OHD36238.1 MAG: hypothetical protein A2087_14820 [Spirochaetes bacterium GWD1_61_31]OHD41493.1 MAG: hypothetical protein A2Y35_06075 [Spirochaetes bacterium GWE1_60_18]OHD61395.1 MAG: hypothetical protein A2Y32_04465 [Spirochaetes bacterium GWF1_60_12]